jgi:polysaccharide transporter, PST family
MQIDRTKKLRLLKNTIMLYMLIFSSYFFGLISIPYLTRVLGPDYFGRVGFALAFMAYFRLLIDFGFILSATEKVAKKRDNIQELSKIVISVNLIKLTLAVMSSIILIVLILTIPRFQQDSLLYVFTFLSVITGSFLPDYLYRGLENMKTITIRTVLIQAFFVFMIILFLKDKEHYYLVPLFTMMGNLVALAGIYFHAIKIVGIKLVRVTPEFVWNTFKASSNFFYSRIATTLYTSTNTFILGLMYPVGSDVVGIYNSADRLASTAKSGFSPIADSLYPYMVKNRDFKLVWKVIYTIMPPVIFGCILVGVYAEPLVALVLGEQFRGAGSVLRILMPIVALTPITYIIGFPVLTPMGLAKYANQSIIFASVFHVVGLVFLVLIGRFNLITMCYVTFVTELIILLYRALAIWRNKESFFNIERPI